MANGIRVRLLLAVCFFVVSVVLVACFRVAPPSPEQPGNETNAQAVTLPLVLSSFHYQGKITMDFAVPMDQALVQKAFSLFAVPVQLLVNNQQRI
jgi:hypothetical protein